MVRWNKKAIRKAGRELVQEERVGITVYQAGSYTVAIVIITEAPAGVTTHRAIGFAKVRRDLDVYNGSLGVQIAVGRALKRAVVAVLDGRELWEYFTPVEGGVATSYGVVRGGNDGGR